MPLPDGTIPLAAGERGALPAPAFLVRFPEDTWTKLAAAAANGSEVSFTVDGGIVSDLLKNGANGQSLNLPGQDPIPLDAHSTGAPSELYSYSDGQLAPVGSAAGRLSVPFTVGATSRAAEKMAQKNVALERQRAQRAERVTGKPVAASTFGSRPVEAANFHASPIPSHAPPMARTQSGPAATAMPTERVPLKTRVVQQLALGPATMQEVFDNVGGEMSDVIRTVNVVSIQPLWSFGVIRACSDGQIASPDGGEPVRYRLRPAQYAKIKIANWKYTYDEVVTVVGLARQAFDELGLQPDDWERSELDRKEKEALATAPREQSPPEIKLPPKLVSPPKPIAVSPPKPVTALAPSLPPSRAESPALGASSSTGKKAAAKDKAGRTKLGKQIAKMRSEHVAKRASSLPNPKGVDGTASPRLGPTSPEDVSPPATKEPSPPAKKDPAPKALKKEKEKPVKAEKPPSKADKRSPPETKMPLAKERKTCEDKKKPRRDYTSSDDSDSDDGRGRARTVKTSTTNGTKASANGSAKRRPSPMYTSSDDEKPKRKRVDKGPRRDEDKEETRALPSFKRRVPTPLDLEKKSTNGHATPAPDSPRTPVNAHPDARVLRKRYDELYSQYEKLSATLAAQFHAAERVRIGDGSPGCLMSESEVQRTVAQWEGWHRELEDIRGWFAA